MAPVLRTAKSIPVVKDPAIKALTRENVQGAIDEYRRLLDGNSDEQAIHSLLQENSYFFWHLMRMRGATPLYSKVKLGSDYETDFVYCDLSSYGPDWRLIEIESPRKKLFTKSGKLTAGFQNALQQVRDWQNWVSEHLDYARSLMPGINYPYGYLFIGRRSELTSENVKTIKRVSYDARGFAHIYTLDRLIASASNALENISNDTGGNWTVPLRAYTHQDLANKKPPETFQWLRRSQVFEISESEGSRIWHYPGSGQDGDPGY